MQFTKKNLLLTLQEIKNEQSIDIDKYIDDVMNNDIPQLSITFINRYKPIDDLGVFNLIYSKRHKTPLYKNFIKGNIDNYEQVCCLGSLLTQMLCYIKTTKDDVTKHAEIIGMDSIMYAIQDFLKTGEFKIVNKVYNNFSILFKDLFIKDGE